MISLNTNATSLMVQKHLSKATQGINRCIEQLTTGYRINHPEDDPANYSIMKQMESKLSSLNVAQDNLAIGSNMLETASDSADLIYNHVTRIRDLCMQASNGTYGESSINAIKAEIQGRLDEINRIYESTEFNGRKLFTSSEIGIQSGTDSSESSRIKVNTGLDIERITSVDELDVGSADVLDRLDGILGNITDYQVRIGASQNRLEFAMESNEITANNLTSSLSTIRDADIAKVSSELIRYQILQQACATLLATANQMPAIALQLLQGVKR